jgi:hypothetical protein
MDGSSVWTEGQENSSLGVAERSSGEAAASAGPAKPYDGNELVEHPHRTICSV